jgi:hypothetical protein
VPLRYRRQLSVDSCIVDGPELLGNAVVVTTAQSLVLSPVGQPTTGTLDIEEGAAR